MNLIHFKILDMKFICHQIDSNQKEYKTPEDELKEEY